MLVDAVRYKEYNNINKLCVELSIEQLPVGRLDQKEVRFWKIK